MILLQNLFRNKDIAEFLNYQIFWEKDMIFVFYHIQYFLISWNFVVNSNNFYV